MVENGLAYYFGCLTSQKCENQFVVQAHATPQDISLQLTGLKYSVMGAASRVCITWFFESEGSVIHPVSHLRNLFQQSSKMAARILANLIVMGSGIMARAFVQAYRQALANASKNGVAQEAVQNTIKRAGKTMTEAEARQILGVAENSSWEEILQKYDNLFEKNSKVGSFYLQSKVHRAKECLEAVHKPKAEGPS